MKLASYKVKQKETCLSYTKDMPTRTVH